MAIVVLALKRNPQVRWAKYAGNWQPKEPEARSYTFQRWWLNNGFHHGLVTVNGRWPNQPKHVFSFVNPCLTREELAQAKDVSSTQQLSTPLRLIYVGRLETAKGAGRALDILSCLQRMGLPATLDLVGDGPERPAFERKAREIGVSERTTFHGWMPRDALVPLYSQSHFMILPCSSSEGWPKVLSEAMAYGVIPIAGNVSSIPQLLETFGAGRAIDPDNIEAFCQAIRDYHRNPSNWKGESTKAVQAAASFTYDRYLESVRNLLGLRTNCEA
jgi:glycosyltransferase involved in cell wall biosynthesis